MIEAFKRFRELPEQDQRDVFETVARRLDTRGAYVEKDLWVCFVLDVLYNRMPAGHPKLFFKGGTSLSKAFGLIQRFSEDIDIIVDRQGLGFAGNRDPTNPRSGLSNKKRAVLFEELKAACSSYVQEGLQQDLASRILATTDGCRVAPDSNDVDQATLLVEYPTLYPSEDVAYVPPRVKIECGARSALVPTQACSVTPYIAEELADGSFAVNGITAIKPERTYWEKLLILHGTYCGFRDQGRLPADADRISRHYYDAAIMTAADMGRTALANHDMLAAVRDHNLVAFRQAWRRFEEAVPGTVRLVPQPELRAVIEQDYAAMTDMVHGETPHFDWIMEQLKTAEHAINGA